MSPKFSGEYWSPTRLDMLSKCGEMFRRRYLEGEKIPPGIALLTGAGVDRAVTADLQNVIDKGELLPDDAVKDLAAKGVNDSIDEAGHILVRADEVEEHGSPNAAVGHAVDTAVSLASLHHTVKAPHIRPVEVQRKWRLKAPGGRDLVGIIDIDEGDSVRDTKTTKKAPGKDAVADSLQMAAYTLAKKVLDDQDEVPAHMDFLVKTKTPYAQTISGTHGPESWAALLSRMEQANRQLDAGVFPPAGEQAWWCSKRWCGYYETCRYVRKPVQVSVQGVKR